MIIVKNIHDSGFAFINTTVLCNPLFLLERERERERESRRHKSFYVHHSCVRTHTNNIFSRKYIYQKVFNDNIKSRIFIWCYNFFIVSGTTYILL